MRQAVRKLVTLVPTILLVSAMTFFLTSLLPGDPALLVLGSAEPNQAAIEAVHKDLGLDKPLPVRYLNYLKDTATGDFGRSYRTRQPVIEAIRERLPVTLDITRRTFDLDGLSRGYGLWSGMIQPDDPSPPAPATPKQRAKAAKAQNKQAKKTARAKADKQKQAPAT